MNFISVMIGCCQKCHSADKGFDEPLDRDGLCITCYHVTPRYTNTFDWWRDVNYRTSRLAKEDIMERKEPYLAKLSWFHILY